MPRKDVTTKTTRNTELFLSFVIIIFLLPVRYIYLSYEYICTVQWEYDKPYTIFLCVTCFVTPLIVTVMCYASVMKVACHQAHEKPPTMVGEIEDEHSFISTYNQSIHIPDIDDPAMTEQEQMRHGSIRRAEWGLESVNEEAKSANSSYHRDSSKDRANSNGDMIVPAVISEGNVSFLCDGNAQAIMSKKSAKTNQIASDIVQSSPNCVGVANERVIPRENSAKFTERNEQVRKMNLPVLTERNVFINPAGALSRIHPAYSGERSGWIRENSFKSKLGIIPEENAGRKDWEEIPMSDIKGCAISLGHLARVREWMCVRLTNKEKTETVLKRK